MPDSTDKQNEATSTCSPSKTAVEIVDSDEELANSIKPTLVHIGNIPAKLKHEDLQAELTDAILQIASCDELLDVQLLYDYEQSDLKQQHLGVGLALISCQATHDKLNFDDLAYELEPKGYKISIIENKSPQFEVVTCERGTRLVATDNSRVVTKSIHVGKLCEHFPLQLLRDDLLAYLHNADSFQTSVAVNGHYSAWYGVSVSKI